MEKLDFFEQLSEALRPIIREEVGHAVADLKKPPELPDRIRLSDACKILCLAPPTVYLKCSRDEIPHIKQNGRLYFSRRKLLELIEA